MLMKFKPKGTFFWGFWAIKRTLLITLTLSEVCINTGSPLTFRERQFPPLMYRQSITYFSWLYIWWCQQPKFLKCQFEHIPHFLFWSLLIFPLKNDRYILVHPLCVLIIILRWNPPQSSLAPPSRLVLINNNEGQGKSEFRFNEIKIVRTCV